MQHDKRYSEAGRAARVAELEDEVLDLVAPTWAAELPPHQEGSLEDYRLLCNELMRLLLEQQLFVFVTAPVTTAPHGETQSVAGTNNESERTLRNPAMARVTGRTTKSVRGARRRTVITSVLESMRQYLLDFTLTTLLVEIKRWATRGRSCFTDQLDKLKREPKSDPERRNFRFGRRTPAACRQTVIPRWRARPSNRNASQKAYGRPHARV